MSLLNERIAKLDLWHIAVPVKSRRDHGIGSVEQFCEVVVVRLVAEGGAEGFGEAACWSVFTGTPEASFAALDRYLRPLVVGRPLSDRAAILAEAQHAVAHCTEAKAALETALLDLEGRIAGLPVWALLGGKANPRLPLSCSIADPDFARDLDLMAQLTQDQVPLVKLKAGFADHAFDVLRMERICRDFEHFGLRVDYNQGLDLNEAPARVRDAAAFAPDFIEQPVRHSQYAMMAQLRQMIDVPLLADESVFGPEDMVSAACMGICDGVSVKVMKAGGLSRAQDVARIAAHHGLTAYGGDMFETGLGHLAGVHMMAATPEISLGCEFYQARYFLVEDILETPFPIQDGHVIVPDGPGLGARPDIEKLDRFAVRRVVA